MRCDYVVARVTHQLSESYQHYADLTLTWIGPVRPEPTDLLRLRGTATLSPDDRALPLSSPTLPAFSTTQPEPAPGPNTHKDMLVTFTDPHLQVAYKGG